MLIFSYCGTNRLGKLFCPFIIQSGYIPFSIAC